MTKPTVAGNAYRWAHPAIEQLVRYRPAAALDFVQADAPTKHFVALAVRGWEAHQDRSERVLWQLSADIFSRPRPIILAELWGIGFGKLSFLKRLPGRVLTRRQYDELVTALLDPRQRHLLHQCLRISPKELAMIVHFSMSQFSPQHLCRRSQRLARSFSTTSSRLCDGIGPTSRTSAW